MVDPQELCCQVQSSLGLWHDPTGLVTLHLGPSAPFLCSAELLHWTRDTAKARDIGIHIHLSETRHEVADTVAQRRKRPVQRLADLGLLTPRRSAVHCMHVNQAETSLLAERAADRHENQHRRSIIDCALEEPADRAGSQRAVTFGCAAAALKIRHLGARNGLPTSGELTRFIGDMIGCAPSLSA